MQVNPSQLAAKLPDRPLKPSEVDDIVDRFEWSVQKIVFETPENAVEYVPEWSAFCPTDDVDTDDPSGEVYEFYMSNDLDSWSGEVLEAETTLSTFVEVTERYADVAGFEASTDRLVFEAGGEEIERELR